MEREQGRELSEVGFPVSDEQWQSLYRSLSRIMLDLGRHTMPKIGSLSVDDAGKLQLSNRPLTVRLAVLENDGLPTDIGHNKCYESTDAYFSDLLNCIDMKLKYQPNAVDDEYDAEEQMAYLTIMRTLLPKFPDRSLRWGPFIFRLTDLNPGNIFVDEHYNITAVVDLEWACFLPIETQMPPFWISGHGFEELVGVTEKKFNQRCNDFMVIFEKEDKQTTLQDHNLATNVMRNALQKNMHWFWQSLNEPDASHNIFINHLRPMFAPQHAEPRETAMLQKMIAPYWILGAPEFIHQKVRDKTEYDKQLQARYRTS